MNFSINNKHIIITYHYVENPSNERCGIFPCSVGEFERQIKFLSENYSFASIHDVYNEAKVNGENKLCAVTFDDGLKDQYENAVPILEKYNATATFFIMSGVYNGYIPTAHKIHILLSIKGPEELISAFNRYIKKHFPTEIKKLEISTDISITDKRRHERKISIKNFKEALSQLGLNRQKEFFKWLFNEYGLNEDVFIRKWFMSIDEVRQLSEKGFSIENHANNHPAFDSISVNDMKYELSSSQDKLDNLFGIQPTIFCYPYGRLSKDLDGMLDVLSKEGIKYAVTTEPRGLIQNDNALLIPRYDTNDIRDFLDKNNV